MEVVKLLKQDGLDALNKYSISVTRNDNDDRIILNYCQINSPKQERIVRECRGLILNGKFDLVARSFYRFFNWGESPVEQANFNWSQCVAHEKEDGSLVNVHHYQNQVHMTTRGSFGQGEVNGTGVTWHKLLSMAWPEWKTKKDSSMNFVGELCSKYNKVVRDYPNPSFYLLSAFVDGEEYSDEIVDSYAKHYGLFRPKRYNLYSLEDVQEYILDRSKHDPTFEGFVLRDNFNQRIKQKSMVYLNLHRLHNNGNLANTKSLVPLIMAGETEEVLLHFPELKSRVEEITKKIGELKTSVDNIWYCFHDTKKDKDFAAEALKSPLSYALFKARQQGGHPFNYLPELTNKIIELVT